LTAESKAAPAWEAEANPRDAVRLRRAEEERGADTNTRDKTLRDKAPAGASKRRADLILVQVAEYQSMQVSVYFISATHTACNSPTRACTATSGIIGMRQINNGVDRNLRRNHRDARFARDGTGVRGGRAAAGQSQRRYRNPVVKTAAGGRMCGMPRLHRRRRRFAGQQRTAFKSNIFRGPARKNRTENEPFCDVAFFFVTCDPSDM
jgi:hypothetical protein